MLTNRIIKDFIYLTGSNLISKVIGFITTIIVAKTISVNDYGTYKWYSTIISYLILLINFGFDIYFYKLILNKNFSIEKVLAIQLKSRLIFGSIIYLLTVLMGYYMIDNFNDRLLFFILSFQIYSFIINMEIFIKIKSFFSFLSISTVMKSLLVLLLVFIFVKDEKDIIKLALIMVFSDLISNIIYWFYLKIKLNLDIKEVIKSFKNLKLKHILYHLKNSMVINLSFFMISIYYNLDSLMLGIFMTKVDVAIYSVAYSFILVAIMPTGILYNVFSPELAKNVYDKKVLKKYILSTTILGIFIFSFLLLTHKYLIMLSYGEKYLPSIDVLFYLSFDIIPCYLAGAFANPINLWGDYKKYLLIVSSGAIGNFVGNLILIPKYGINGAILTTILSEVLVFIFALRYWIKNKGLLR